MKYTRVRRAVSAVMIDSYDEDRNPELVKVNGTVTFTPLLKDGDVVQWAGPNGPQSLVLAPIECFISNGIIMHRGGEGIFLAAGGPGVQPDVIQWKATFKNMQAGGWAFNLKPVMFDAVPDGEVDLTLVSPIAGASEPILRGPAGVGLKSITVEGSELVVTVTSEAGTYVMSRIPLEDVVRAEADQAVASAQAAIKADVDAAAASATKAKSSQDAAAASATDAQNAASQTVASAQAAIKADVDAAAGSASAASSSASAAQASASTATTQAKAASTSAANAKTSETNAKTSETNAKQSETNAGKSATTATSEANRAKTEADRAAQKATEVANTVEGNYAPIGHHHPWSEIDDKPATFPPATHTHVSANITDAQNGYTLTSVATNSGKLVEISTNGTLEVHAANMTNGNGNAVTNKAYVDGAVAGKANIGHKHEIADVNGLQALLAGIMPRSYVLQPVSDQINVTAQIVAGKRPGDTDNNIKIPAGVHLLIVDYPKNVWYSIWGPDGAIIGETGPVSAKVVRAVVSKPGMLAVYTSAPASEQATTTLGLTIIPGQAPT